jgi:hypothetical protein
VRGLVTALDNGVQREKGLTRPSDRSQTIRIEQKETERTEAFFETER